MSRVTKETMLESRSSEINPHATIVSTTSANSVLASTGELVGCLDSKVATSTPELADRIRLGHQLLQHCLGACEAVHVLLDKNQENEVPSECTARKGCSQKLPYSLTWNPQRKATSICSIGEAFLRGTGPLVWVLSMIRHETCRRVIRTPCSRQAAGIKAVIEKSGGPEKGV